MRPETKKIGLLTARQLLLVLFDLSIDVFSVFLTPKYRSVRRDVAEYHRWRKEDGQRVAQQIYRLKQQGLIRQVIEGKESYFELTSQGKRAAFWELLSILQDQNKQNWDGKWRIVVFDIPEDERDERREFRRFLQRLKLYQLQKSVYVSPFDYFVYIDSYVRETYLSGQVNYIVADIIQGEEKIIQNLLEDGILTRDQLKRLAKLKRSAKRSAGKI